MFPCHGNDLVASKVVHPFGVGEFERIDSVESQRSETYRGRSRRAHEFYCRRMSAQKFFDGRGFWCVGPALRGSLQERQEVLRRGHRKSVGGKAHDVGTAAVRKGESDGDSVRTGI